MPSGSADHGRGAEPADESHAAVTMRGPLGLPLNIRHALQRPDRGRSIAFRCSTSGLRFCVPGALPCRFQSADNEDSVMWEAAVFCGTPVVR